MRKKLWTFFGTLIIVLWLTVTITPGSYSQDKPTITDQAQESEQVKTKPASPQVKQHSGDVMLGKKQLFQIQTNFGPITPERRAKDISRKIAIVADDSAISLDAITLQQHQGIAIISSDGFMIAGLTEGDAKVAKQSLSQFSNDRLKQIKTAIKAYREARTLQAYARGSIELVIATIALIATIFLINKIFPRIFRTLRTLQQTRFSALRLQSLELLSSQQIARFLLFLTHLTRWLLIFTLVYIYVPLVLSFFPQTAPFSQQIVSTFWGTVSSVVGRLIAYFPNLFLIGLICVIAYYSSALSKTIFDALGRGALSVPGFYPEWAEPTHRIVSFLISALAAILIFPYLPASNSPGFQGVSIFLGALVTFGSTAAIGNIISGIVIIYTRAFQPGDVIEVNDKRGKVIDKTMLSTRILTPQNEIITIPNSMLLASNIINFTASKRDIHQPLILHTTVTLGYDTPWRKIHQALINAALRTEGILNEPPPFVLQSSLDDFYVSYRLMAYADDPTQMPQIYSALHQHIQDSCFESEIEILSPHYAAVRDGNQAAIPQDYLPENYTAPGFRLQSVSSRSTTDRNQSSHSLNEE
jgi:small-conductance mechanosensitive channel